MNIKRVAYNPSSHSATYEQSPVDLPVDDILYWISARDVLVFLLAFVAVRVDLRGL